MTIVQYLFWGLCFVTVKTENTKIPSGKSKNDALRSGESLVPSGSLSCSVSSAFSTWWLSPPPPALPHEPPDSPLPSDLSYFPILSSHSPISKAERRRTVHLSPVVDVPVNTMSSSPLLSSSLASNFSSSSSSPLLQAQNTVLLPNLENPNPKFGTMNVDSTASLLASSSTLTDIVNFVSTLKPQTTLPPPNLPLPLPHLLPNKLNLPLLQLASPPASYSRGFCYWSTA